MPRPETPAVEIALLVVRLQAGDEAAFVSLFRIFGPDTLGYLKSLVGEDAEDLQQDVWMTVFRSVRTLQDPLRFRSWVFSLSRYRAIDLLRREKHHQAAMPHWAEVEESRANDEARPHESLEDLIAGLPPPQREILILRFRHDMSYEEIALMTGHPLGTVKTRIHHAKRKLANHLVRENT